MKTVAIIGTFDTKGEEFAYVKARFEELGINTLTIHCGVFDPQTMPDVPNTEVAAAVDPMLIDIMVVLCAMPVATNGTMLCYQYGGDSRTMAQGTFVTTVLSIITIPILVMVIG